MERKDIYLDAKAIEHAESMIRVGWVSSVSAAVRLALAKAAPMVTPSTP